MSVVMDAAITHSTKITQALASEKLREGLLEILLDHAGLWEGLRERGHAA